MLQEWFRAMSTSGETSSQGICWVLCSCRQEIQPAHHLTSLPMTSTQLREQRLLNTYSNTLYFTQKKKNKNRSPPSPSSHGKNNRLPSSNERLLKAVSYMQNSHTKFTRYRIWPKSLFRFMFFFLNMPLEVRPALTVTHLKKEALKHLSFLEFGFISQLCAQAPLLAKQMAQQLLLIKYLRASPNDVNFPNSGIHSNRPAIRLQLRWSKEFLS